MRDISRRTLMKSAAIIGAASVRLELPPEALLDLLFADLPGERPVRTPEPPPTSPDSHAQ